MGTILLKLNDYSRYFLHFVIPFRIAAAAQHGQKYVDTTPSCRCATSHSITIGMQCLAIASQSGAMVFMRTGFALIRTG